jgi:hypothetical protein
VLQEQVLFCEIFSVNSTPVFTVEGDGWLREGDWWLSRGRWVAKQREMGG